MIAQNAARVAAQRQTDFSCEAISDIGISSLN